MPIGDPQNPPNNLTTLPESIVSAVWAVLSGAIVVLIGALVWRAPRDESTALLEFSLVMTTLLVVAPHVQRLYFTALVIPVGVLTALLIERPGGAHRTLIRAALIVTALASTYLPLVFGGRQTSLAYQSWSPYSIATIFMLVVLMIVTREQKNATDRAVTP